MVCNVDVNNVRAAIEAEVRESLAEERKALDELRNELKKNYTQEQIREVQDSDREVILIDDESDVITLEAMLAREDAWHKRMQASVEQYQRKEVAKAEEV